jgi:hypothetical protein
VSLKHLFAGLQTNASVEQTFWIQLCREESYRLGRRQCQEQLDDRTLGRRVSCLFSRPTTWFQSLIFSSWLANVLKSVPISQLENKRLLIQGNVATTNEVIKLWEQKHGVSIVIHATIGHN